MAKKEQFEILFQVLRRFDQTGVLNELMLIGSWCLYFYRFHFGENSTVPTFRTLDVDFLIPHPTRVRKKADVPAILKEEGFIPIFNRASGIVKYNHPELQVEFLVPELGKGGRMREVKNLHVKAVALRKNRNLIERQESQC